MVWGLGVSLVKKGDGVVPLEDFVRIILRLNI